MTKLRTGNRKPLHQFFKDDSDLEKGRKDQPEKLCVRPPEQILEYLAQMENANKSMDEKEFIAHLEREQKVKELQKMIDAQRADNWDYINRRVKVEPKSQRSKCETKFQKSKRTISSPLTQIIGASNMEDCETLESRIQWPHSTSGVFLCSEKMQLPSTIGEQKTQTIQLSMEKLNIHDLGPIATVDAVNEFNELRSDILEMYTLRTELTNQLQQIRTLKARYLKKTHVKLEMPDKLCGRHPESVLVNVNANPDNKPIDGHRIDSGDC